MNPETSVRQNRSSIALMMSNCVPPNVIGRPTVFPGTRFHFKTEVLRFGRVGRSYTSAAESELPNAGSSTKRHFIAWGQKTGQLRASLACVLGARRSGKGVRSFDGCRDARYNKSTIRRAKAQRHSSVAQWQSIRLLTGGL